MPSRAGEFWWAWEWTRGQRFFAPCGIFAQGNRLQGNRGRVFLPRNHMGSARILSSCGASRIVRRRSFSCVGSRGAGDNDLPRNKPEHCYNNQPLCKQLLAAEFAAHDTGGTRRGWYDHAVIRGKLRHQHSVRENDAPAFLDGVARGRGGSRKWRRKKWESGDHAAQLGETHTREYATMAIAAMWTFPWIAAIRRYLPPPSRRGRKCVGGSDVLQLS